jgi:hypothetical protein
MWGRGGLEVHMSLSKVSFFLHILDLLGGFLWKALEPSKFNFLLLVMEKDTYNDIFARRLLKTK